MYFKQKIRVVDRIIGQEEPVFIIAEAGLSHFGSRQKAFDLVELAISSGADAVKFQIFNTEDLISKQSKDWYERFKAKELPYKVFSELQEYCNEKGIIFFATAHDKTSFNFLESIKVPLYKIGSGEISNINFISKIAYNNLPVIVSTGMYSQNDVESVIEIFKKASNPNLIMLHCVTSYPTPAKDVNLLAMLNIKNNYHVITGYSDHTKGIHFPVAAVALGAKVIEKHISLDFDVPNAQDWKVACGEQDLPLLVQQIREVESGIGSGIKELSQLEKQNIKWARKSLVATEDIPAGSVIQRHMLTEKRPGTGISPSEYSNVIGKKVKEKINYDEILMWEKLENET